MMASPKNDKTVSLTLELTGSLTGEKSRNLNGHSQRTEIASANAANGGLGLCNGLEKIELVDELINLQASNAVQHEDNDDNDDNKKKAAAAKKKAPIDLAFEKLKTELTLLDPSRDEFLMLNQYVENTRNATIPGSNRWGGNDWGDVDYDY